MEDLVTIVTGAGSGMGAAIAAALLEKGGAVVAADLHADGLDALTSRYSNRRLATIAADVSEDDAGERIVSLAKEKFGSLTGLVNCAGICGVPRPLDEIGVDEFRRTMDVNLIGAFIMMRAALGHLRGVGGSIVNISSVVGLRPSAYLADYGASKFGIVSLTLTSALEEAPNQVRVNAICPGVIETAMQRRLKSHFDAVGAPFDLSTIPMGRFGAPEDVAKLAVWLLGDDSAYVTGQTIAVDGAYSLR